VTQMSITSALSSALTGLTATSRQAETVASNVANATTPGYARREVSLSALSLGGSGQGVSIKGITRQVDRFLIDDRRVAQAAAGNRDVRAAFLKQMEKVFGDPTDPGSLSARIAAFDTALMEAASRPESEARLATVADTARLLAQTLNTASDAVQAERLRADGRIATTVDDLNTALRQVRELNSQIRSFSGAGRDVSALLDQRQQIVDGIAAIVPIREVEREHGQIALMTTGGAVLLDGRESVFEFTPVHTLVPEMTQASGGLSGLTLNGRPMATTGETSLVLGGSLAGLFAVRDELAVQGQARLDAVARDLVERFIRNPFREPILLNVNIPDCSTEELKGIRVTRLGKRHKAEPTVRGTTPRGDTVYWIGPAGQAADAGEGTDFSAVEQGYVSITPLRIDLTHNGQMSPVLEWLDV